MINIDFDDAPRQVRIEMIPKGSGSENGSFLKMLIPADGVDGIKTYVVDRIMEVGGRVCPPTIVGVGIGGTSDLCMHLAKVAATRPLGSACADPEGEKLEKMLSIAVNSLGIGPQGLGGARHRLCGPRRDRGDPHHDEPGRGQHADATRRGARRRDDHAGRRGPTGSESAMAHHTLECRSTSAKSARCASATP